MNRVEPWHNPIVEETHALRADLSQKFNDNLKEYSDSAVAHCLVLGFNTCGESAQLDRSSDNPKDALLPCP